MIAVRWLLAGLLCGLLGICGAATPGTPVKAAEWQELSAAHKQILAPLERDWKSIDAPRRAKWLEVASRYPSMPAEEQTRLQARMAEWARMTPSERSRARLQFQEARQVPHEERQAKWQAYQALPANERRDLAQRARPAAKPASGVANGSTSPASTGPTKKQNLVQATSLPRSKAVTPTSQQARPGATTTTMTTRASPPAHHQAGLPKIAATPGFVDPSTLLPQRGPQGAAVRSAATASEPAAQP